MYDIMVYLIKVCILLCWVLIKSYMLLRMQPSNNKHHFILKNKNNTTNQLLQMLFNILEMEDNKMSQR